MTVGDRPDLADPGRAQNALGDGHGRRTGLFVLPHADMLETLRDHQPRDANEATLAHPDHVETVDLVGGKLRARQDRLASAISDAHATDEHPGAKVGRYQLLEFVGAGGMGLVWGAWDPELERRVALKLVRIASRESRDRIIREGQVLARFSHPNVVQIFDLGEIDDQVFLVMEWVRGTTLRAYAEQAPGLHPLLDAYRQAGHGLAAAHGAGVIHRDFKPDNVIRGNDGRIRVLDFGLAHASDPEPNAVDRHAGTPRYMAPEHARGDAITAAADQFAFCVALREALERAGTVPNWITTIIHQGTSTKIGDRFASMGDLLAALDRDPARQRRRSAIGFAAVAVAAGAFAIGRSRAAEVPPALEPCSGGAAELSTAWSAGLRLRVAEHLRSLGMPVTAEEIDGTARKLDDYAAAWISEHRATCEANERKALTPHLHGARVFCLRRARSQLASVVELLGEARTVDELAAGQRSVGALPDVSNCQFAGAVAPPPAAMADQVRATSERVERAWVRAAARQRTALSDAAAATVDAYATAYSPLIGRALLVEGWAATLADQPTALAALDKAWKVALTAYDEPLAVEAYARWLYANVRMAVPASFAGVPSTPAVAIPPATVIAKTLDNNATTTALEMWPMMRVLAERLGEDGRFARSLLYNNVALQLMVVDDKPRARELLQLAWHSAGDKPPIELAAVEENLARLERDPVASERRLRAAFMWKQAVLGSMHPDTLSALRNLAMVIRERAAARAGFASACRGLREREQTGGFQRCAYEAGWLADEDGDSDAARALMSSAVGLPDVRGRIASAYLALGNRSGSSQLLAELDRFASQTLPNWLDRVNAADALIVLAHAAERASTAHTDNSTSADRAWQRTLTMLETIDYVHFDRRKARVRAVVAERWARSRPAEARVLANQALTWYRGVRGDEELVRRLERVAALPAR